MARARLERLLAARQAALEPDRIPAPGAQLHALGWATVDLDRTVAELAGELGVNAGTFADAVGSATLGARCRVAPAVLPEGLALVILEPSTEGRLATSLARLDEGPSVAWYAVTRRRAGGKPDPEPARPGPFGPERLVAGDPVHGPHRFLIEVAPGTIAP
jgi:hypothetical protein